MTVDTATTTETSIVDGPTGIPPAMSPDSLNAIRQKLLDLTARNRLLNFPINQRSSSIRVIDELPDQIFQTLVNEKTMQFASVPDPKYDELLEYGYIVKDDKGNNKRIKSAPDAKEWAKTIGLNTDYELPKVEDDQPHTPEHTDHKIQLLYFPDEMEAQLRSIYNKAQTAIEETGAGILYLALGFLEWYESKESDKPRLAPLFTIPVMLERSKLDPKDGLYKFTLKYTGEDILPNLSLKAKLMHDFALGLPDLEEDTSPEHYFSQVAHIIEKAQPKWKVCRQACLGLLNFGKMLMYLDLDPSRWPEGEKNITQHAIINRFFSSKETKGDSSYSNTEYLIDEIKEVHQDYALIDDADSSQHSALIDVMKGKNLVIEGPPGTGKSQTITNLIATAMLAGKKVLFVAEKLAALEVVKRRLDKAGLGDFCLELHSHKSQKRKVLDDIQTRLTNAEKLKSVIEIDAEIARYEDLKQRLNQYAEDINAVWEKTGKTIHQILSGATRYRTALDIDPTELHVEALTGKTFDSVKQLYLKDLVKTFVELFQNIRKQIGEGAEIYQHPWSGVQNTDIHFFDSERIVNQLTLWQTSLQDYSDQIKSLASTWDIDSNELISFEQNADFVRDVITLGPLVGTEYFPALSSLTNEAIEDCNQYLEDFHKVQEYYQLLKSEIIPEKLSLLASGESSPYFDDITKHFGTDSSVVLSDIIKSTLELESLNNKLKRNYQEISELQKTFPTFIAERMQNSFSGFQFTIDLIDVVSSLPQELIKHRSEFFDEDELNTVLPKLEQQLITLLPQREYLSSIYRLSYLPELNVLLSLRDEIKRSGIFKWFDSKWRQSRTMLKSLAQSTDIKIKQLIQQFDQLVIYAEGVQQLKSENYDQYLGHHYAGLDTNIQSCKMLRHWYQKIRKQYGIGFGPLVEVGSYLLKLDAQVIKGIQLLNQNKMVSNIQNSLSSIDEILAIAPVIKLNIQPHTELVGEGGLLLQLANELKLALIPIQSWFLKQDLSLKDLALLMEKVEALESLQAELNDDPIMEQIFRNSVQLQFGLNTKNDQALAQVASTVQFANKLNNNIKTNTVASAIRKMHSVNEYVVFTAESQKIRCLWDDQIATYNIFASGTELDRTLWLQSTDGSLQQTIKRNDNAIQNSIWLNGWINFIRHQQTMHENGLSRLWKLVISSKLDVYQSTKALYLAAYDQLSREIYAAKPYLARTSGHELNAIQKAFREYDKKLIELQRKRIASIIAKQDITYGISGGKVANYSELSLITHELGKKARHLPIRQLINRAGKALIELKPCFMMGPMSAAHYLEPGKIEFDLVVMDEASQVKPEDALGVIARGKQVVVVGDPKQLPPTSFFDKADQDEDDEETAAISQTDSILDAALPIFPMRRLRWHYRSQHEHLIAFSNRKFYDSDLVVFPSPNAFSPEFGIKFIRIKNGRFINQHNIEEARIVAKAVIQHALEHPDETLGVVAMSSKQRDQIERAIDELTKENTRYSDAIDKLRMQTDNLFVKNLENVQGDERDVIFISITYGPSEVAGRVYQRFGPINSDVGWRRLNVLFTRSKKRMHIFSSMVAEDIQISENTKRGVVALRGFLHFAEKGNIDGIGQFTGKAPDSDFEVAVIQRLNAAGFECEPQVGVAGFYIDIAVKDPGQPGRYLMGIECDGATYHSAKSARDRDRLRQEVLERLGWRIRRIWSTDWFSNPAAELDPVIRELNSLKTTLVDPAPQAPVQVTEAIAEDSNLNEVDLTSYQNEQRSLAEQLQSFAQDVIAKVFPDVESEHRLLRPAMIEALVEHQPFSRSEFVERIPKYLRDATNIKEAKQYLDHVLSIIEGQELEDSEAI